MLFFTDYVTFIAICFVALFYWNQIIIILHNLVVVYICLITQIKRLNLGLIKCWG